MAVEVIMPKAGSEMVEGEIVKWFKKEGDQVKAGDILLEIVTDKVNMEIEAEESGTLLKILHPEGAIVPVVEAIAYIGEKGEAVGLANQAEVKTENTKVENKVSSVAVEVAAKSEAEVINHDNSLVRATPAARFYARRHKINLVQVRGSGPKGRIHKDDVVAYKKHEAVKISPLAKKIALAEGLNVQVLKGTGPQNKIMKEDVLRLMHGHDLPEKVAKKEAQKPILVEKTLQEHQAKNSRWGEIETIPMSPMRKVIAKRMSESYFKAPVFVANIDVDMTNMLDFRKKVLDTIMEATGKKISVTDCLSYAVVKALMKHPQVNSSLSRDEKEIYRHHFVNLAIAVGLDDGLLVPVIKGADKMSLKDLVVASKEITTKAVQNKLKPDEMAESTFTISNLGMYGISSFAPIINQPNNAILGISATIKKPVVINDQIVIRPMMTLTLTADHRVIDGLEGAKFLNTLKDAIENPLSLLI